MRTSHMYLFGVALATFGLLVAGPATAQDEIPEATEATSEAATLTAEQQALFDSWPPDQQYAYETWPSETKAYYWSLSPDRQGLFWRISDDDKIALTAMTGPERESAWETIEASANTPPADGPT